MTTTGDRFLECLPFVLAQECPHPDDWSNPKNFSDDAHDPGGKTMCGIIQSEYDTWRKHLGLPTRDVRQMTEAEGQAIYRENYWEPHCDGLSEGLDLVYFDESVNTGTTEATKVLQFTLGIAVDGDWGPKTDAAVAAITDVDKVVAAYSARREAVYQEMKGYPYFGKGWTARVAAINSDAVDMLA